ncbi:acyloxyacyl hydrolase [Psychroflexus sp. CAK8W]|uniref:Acyloxyacyl hydrolase n=1 Tax=Psychroflexus longus TaxID=2873596 RepID=A0ABS7XG45_9FLAO|nr:acyloxyacyl hydrolase [Psychroflexus longus]MBZ9777905.1 acyloxyacyl hydrolase [Psychroflexus longus]
MISKCFISLSILLLSICGLAQKKRSDVFHADYLYGRIMRHSPQILHLIQGPTHGILFSWERKTYGDKDWQQLYNYPSYGASLLIQDMGSPELGRVYSLHGEYRFFFWERKLSLKAGLGAGYIPNTYDPETNPKNTAYGSALTASIIFGLEYRFENIFDLPLDLKFGGFLVHYSNGKTKSPNTSTNNYGLQAGLSYKLSEAERAYKTSILEPVSTSWSWDIIAASGANDSGIWGEANEAFLTLTTSVNKRLSHRSRLNLGLDAFFTPSVKTFIQYRASAFPEEDQFQGDEDWRRVGLFLGHELYLGQWSVISQVGYYVYYPIEYLDREYIRVGLRRYITDKFYVSLMLKSHYSKAEAIEYGIGLRL